MFSTGKTERKCPVAGREPGYPAAGSSPWRNPKAPKIMPQKRAPKGALKWFCVAHFGEPGKRWDEAGKSQLTSGMGSGHARTHSHPTFVPAQPKLCLFLPCWVQEEPAPGRGILIIRSRLNPGKNKEEVGKSSGSSSPDPSAPIFVTQLLFQRVFRREMVTVVVLVATISGCILYPCLSCCADAPGSPFPNPASQPGSTTPAWDAPSIDGILGSTSPFSPFFLRWVLWEVESLSDRG